MFSLGQNKSQAKTLVLFIYKFFRNYQSKEKKNIGK